VALPLRKHWSTKDPERLQEELHELQRSLNDELVRLGARSRVRPSSQTDVFANYGDVVRLDPTSSGLVLTLPPANPAAAGATIEALIESASGAVTVQAVDALVNQAETITLTARVGRALFACNGVGWFLVLAIPSGSITTDDILDGTIVNVDISASAAIALSKMATQAANTVVANATGSAAVPTAVSVGTNSVLGRVAGNIVAAGLVNAQVDASAAIALSKLATQAESTLLLRAVGAGTGVPIAGTGAQAGQIVRFSTLQTVTSGGSIALDDDATGLLLDADMTVTNITGANLDGRTIMLRVGSGFSADLAHLSGGTGEIACPNQLKFQMYSRDAVFIRNEVSIWRVVACERATVVQAITADASATNATTNLSGGTHTILANTVRVGTVFRLTIFFAFDHAGAAATPTLTFEVLIAGVVERTCVVTPVSTAGTYYGTAVAYMTVRTIGTTGTVMISPIVTTGVGATIPEAIEGPTATSTDAINTTIDNTLQLRCRMTTAVASETLTVQQGFTERLTP
jgi:hypothetical protein